MSLLVTDLDKFIIMTYHCGLIRSVTVIHIVQMERMKTHQSALLAMA